MCKLEKEGSVQSKTADVLCTFKAILFSSQLRSHLTLHLSIPPSSEEVEEEGRFAQGSLCYLETDGFSGPANQRLWKTDPSSPIGRLLPGTHWAINGHVIVSSGSTEANYTPAPPPPFFWLIFSSRPLSHTHTQINLLGLCSLHTRDWGRLGENQRKMSQLKTKSKHSKKSR